MKIIFEEEYLSELYENGKAKNKKYRFQKNVIEKYVQTIDKLRVATKIEDLFPIKSLNYKKLIGIKKGLESVRVDQKYRIEFKTAIEGDEPDTITICSIIELSNHYK
ncbi:type II toxin-antitoxin system RelE/ParE family toxin [Lutibacter sp.]|uniref:type II toxin-antitoxin system RelE/ParE family toxin n=1 Tax=Lutibacter sp. TaxID=1925666 RepID=UPI0027365DE0|nr:type II toxin-antitoxin system RelE/ParE family toxin [Lutibacter sp.]MDP3313041.1 type II toxin-antitoxin system RelE/ParE family toxin [Lutibacter sp.]